ncbi:sugar phosphate isomerase/epimerase family protein [Nostoc sp. C117]|uniref:sugar phosphate isomerase/epimerase family protein n=1 Tax=Nostoc sp. C117 TaxID=3349875 RepID=UPI00370DD14C
MTNQLLGKKDIYLSFFMFTTDVKPSDLEYRKVVIKHMKELNALGYNGFELPIVPNGGAKSYSQEIDEYSKLRDFMDGEGLEDVQIATNVGTTRTFDPSSPDAEQRQKALEYLKSRVDITAALGGEIMMGPLVIPYGIFPLTDDNNPIWSDQLQDYLQTRYTNAQPILNQLGEYAEPKNVKLAIEPITHWETPGINKLSQLIKFLEGVSSKQVGVVIDSSHEILDGDGPEVFAEQVQQLADEERLHYVQVSPPDRGAVHTSWIPWQSFLEPILAVYDGPIAVEIFNAIPAFLNSLRLTRRKFWIPGEDTANQYPSAYDIAQKAIDITQRELDKIICN